MIYLPSLCYKHLNLEDKWEPICPTNDKEKILWMIGELGEVIDIVKKNRGRPSVETSKFRRLVEELVNLSPQRKTECINDRYTPFYVSKIRLLFRLTPSFPHP